MRQKPSRPRPRVALLTLGCAKNTVDSEQIASLLDARGVEVVHSAVGCKVAVVNTCGFIQPAKEEAIEVILAVADLKGEGGLKTLIVTGCLAQRYGEDLRGSLPEADVLIGIDPAGAAAAALAALGISGGCPAGAVARTHRLTPRAWSYLLIAQGCDNRCAYCAIPLIRGPLRSRPPEELLAEARFLADQGVRELNVIAQDTTAYGRDVEGGRDIAWLLRELCRVDGIEWVRLLYAHPAHVDERLIEVMAAEEKVCPYMDIPLQHVSDRILAAMGRRVTRRDIEGLIERLRDRIPGVTLRTTFLVGLPGETEREFRELVRFVREVRFERMGAFAYSREEGTPAAELPGQVPARVAERRRRRLMEVQQEIAFELAAARVGERTRVLMDEDEAPDGEFRPARGVHEAPDVDPVIYVEGEAPPEGEFAEVEITDSMGYDCIAQAASERDDEGE